MRIDPAGMPVSSARLCDRLAMLRGKLPPTDRARRAETKAIGRRATTNPPSIAVMSLIWRSCGSVRAIHAGLLQPAGNGNDISTGKSISNNSVRVKIDLGRAFVPGRQHQALYDGVVSTCFQGRSINSGRTVTRSLASRLAAVPQMTRPQEAPHAMAAAALISRYLLRVRVD